MFAKTAGLKRAEASARRSLMGSNPAACDDMRQPAEVPPRQNPVVTERPANPCGIERVATGPQPSGEACREPFGELQPSARGRLRAADVYDVEPARSYDPHTGSDLRRDATFTRQTFAGDAADCRPLTRSNRQVRRRRQEAVRAARREIAVQPHGAAANGAHLRATFRQQLAKRTQRALCELRAFAADSCGLLMARHRPPLRIRKGPPRLSARRAFSFERPHTYFA